MTTCSRHSAGLATLTGTRLLVVVPSPGAPALLSPQQYAAPAGVTPQVEVAPALRVAKVSPPGTANGAVSSSSSPVPRPQQYAAPAEVSPQVYEGASDNQTRPGNPGTVRGTRLQGKRRLSSTGH